MRQDNLQRKSRADDASLSEMTDQDLSVDEVSAVISKLTSSSVKLKNLTPQKKSRLIIALLRCLEKQHKQILVHQNDHDAHANADQIAAVENAIELLSSELDTVIDALSNRIAISQNTITSLAQWKKKVWQQAEQGRSETPQNEIHLVESAAVGIADTVAEAPSETVAETTIDAPENDTASHASSSGSCRPHLALVEEDEDDEAEDEGVEERLFSLAEHYQNEAASGRHTAKTQVVIEVVKLCHGEVEDIQYLREGQSYFIDVAGKRFRLARHGKGQALEFFFDEKYLSGEFRQKIAAVGTGEAIHGAQRGINKITLPEQLLVQIHDGHIAYILRRVVPIQSPDVALEVPLPFLKRNYRIIAFSTVFHLLAIMIIGGWFASASAPKTETQPEFVTIDVEQLQRLKKPVVPDVPKKVVEKKPEPEPVKQKPVQKQEVAKRETVKKAPPAPEAGGGNKEGGNLAKRNVEKTGLLAALGTPKGEKKGAKEALAKVSSLDAVSSLNAQDSQLKIAGLTAKVEGSRMTLPTGEIIDTKGSTAVLRSGGVDGKGQIARMEHGGTGQGKVNAMVSADLSKNVHIQGGMSREAVKKVIDAHMEEVVYCYESALLGAPGLSGKAVFEWKILMSGQVGETSIASTTLQSDSIHSCISSAIKTWQFPKPTGAEVVVSYPFIFDMVGF